MRRWSLLILAACTGEATTDPPLPTGITWSEHVAPIVEARCVSCHVSGGPSFPLTTYDEARVQAPAMVSAVEAGRMPPWSAEETEDCVPPHGFEGDLRVPAEDARILRAWMEDDTPEGDPIAALVPALVETIEADEVWTVDDPFVINEVADSVVCHNVGEPLAADAWLSAARLDPVDLRVAHHAVLLVDLDGDGLQPWEECAGGVGVLTPVVFWAPGTAPFQAPPRSGIPIPAGAQFVVQVHYHPVEPVGAVDPPRIELDWTDGRPDRDAYLEIYGNKRSAEDGLRPGREDRDGPEFRIPAGIENHLEVMEDVLDAPRSWNARIFGIGHHMHRFGRSMRSRVVSGESEGACLLDTPRWDFDWHRFYRYDAAEEDLPTVAAGDRVELSCWYDNSMEQEGPRQAILEAGLDAPVDVGPGAGPTDEMCTMLLGLLVERE